MSKFAGVIAAKRDPENVPEAPDADNMPETPQEAASTPVAPAATPVKATPKARNVAPVATEAPAVTEARKPGRPLAKRSDPDFVQTTAYIRGTTHRSVKIALLNEGQGREYSELVEELLAKWLKSQKSNGSNS